MKNYLGECSLKVTRRDGERSEILVSSPGLKAYACLALDQIFKIIISSDSKFC